MKEYQVEVTSVTTVYVEAESEEDAMDKAYVLAIDTIPDEYNAVIVDVTGWED